MAMTLARKVVDDLSGGSDPHCRSAQARSQVSDCDCGDAGSIGEIDFRPPAAEYKERSALSESAVLLRALWRSPQRLRALLLGAGIVAVLLGNMVGQLRLNTWNGAFFDAVA